MAVKVLIFGTDDLYPQLKNFYDEQVRQENFEIVGYANLDGDEIKISDIHGGGIG